MSKPGKGRSPLAKRIAGLAVVGAVIAIGVPVLASVASGEDSSSFIAADGATRAETGVDPGSLTAADGAKLARTGSLTLSIEADDAGAISAVGTSPVGAGRVKAVSDHGWVEVGKASEIITEPASVTATGPGVVELTLRLTPAARAAYAAGADDPMMLRISSSGASGSLVTMVAMGG